MQDRNSTASLGIPIPADVARNSKDDFNASTERDADGHIADQPVARADLSCG
jgi:hypothetical protein